eukprot:TRINITY_DN66286_c6_g8_i1.p2 TRINITY_DN66286_c6_g8~~TRINITY_DN66286_c6_g8_i1.p2  ORF type:complete len:809 (-),score=376.52 TRINITY_DN66286_c6_g8_i1:859-3285(-)
MVIKCVRVAAAVLVLLAVLEGVHGYRGSVAIPDRPEETGSCRFRGLSGRCLRGKMSFFQCHDGAIVKHSDQTGCEVGSVCCVPKSCTITAHPNATHACRKRDQCLLMGGRPVASERGKAAQGCSSFAGDIMCCAGVPQHPCPDLHKALEPAKMARLTMSSLMFMNCAAKQTETHRAAVWGRKTKYRCMHKLHDDRLTYMRLNGFETKCGSSFGESAEDAERILRSSAVKQQLKAGSENSKALVPQQQGSVALKVRDVGTSNALMGKVEIISTKFLRISVQLDCRYSKTLKNLELTGSIEGRLEVGPTWMCWFLSGRFEVKLESTTFDSAIEMVSGLMFYIDNAHKEEAAANIEERLADESTLKSNDEHFKTLQELHERVYTKASEFGRDINHDLEMWSRAWKHARQDYLAYADPCGSTNKPVIKKLLFGSHSPKKLIDKSRAFISEMRHAVSVFYPKLFGGSEFQNKAQRAVMADLDAWLQERVNGTLHEWEEAREWFGANVGWYKTCHNLDPWKVAGRLTSIHDKMVEALNVEWKDMWQVFGWTRKLIDGLQMVLEEERKKWEAEQRRLRDRSIKVTLTGTFSSGMSFKREYKDMMKIDRVAAEPKESTLEIGGFLAFSVHKTLYPFKAEVPAEKWREDNSWGLYGRGQLVSGMELQLSGQFFKTKTEVVFSLAMPARDVKDLSKSAKLFAFCWPTLVASLRKHLTGRMTFDRASVNVVGFAMRHWLCKQKDKIRALGGVFERQYRFVFTPKLEIALNPISIKMLELTASYEDVTSIKFKDGVFKAIKVPFEGSYTQANDVYFDIVS